MAKGSFVPKDERPFFKPFPLEKSLRRASRLPCVKLAPRRLGAFLGSPYTGEPRNAPQSLGANFAQGWRKMRRSTFAGRGIQPLSHGVSILNRRASSPCTGEPRMCAKARAANGEGAEIRPPSEWCEPRTREPRTAAEPPSQKQKNKPSQSGGEKKIFFLKGER